MARLPYPDDSSLDPRALRALEQVPVRINLFSMLAHAPSLIGPVLRLGGAILTRMELDPALRELAILRVATMTTTGYEWHHHEPMARRAGLDAAAVEAVARVEQMEGGASHEIDRAGRLVVRLVDETLADGAPSADLVRDIDSELGPTQLVELVCTVGYYCMIGQLLRALDVDIDNSTAVGGERPAGT